VPARHHEAGHPQEVPLQRILGAGRALILLDGLDEVRDADSSRVLRQIREFSQQFHQNQFVITCRIAAREYTFEQFTEVEIADFDDKQIADFSGKWFRCKNDPIKAERFVQKLRKTNPSGN
jgi:predicted NACHT family NTPase